MGYWTLLMAMKVIDDEELDHLKNKLKEADEKDIHNWDKAYAEIFDKFETGLTLLGATCVEDWLQNEVPETINAFREGGIKVWMLTGDKLETAWNIAQSCKLIHDAPDGTKMHVWELRTAADARKQITDNFMQ